ncbi:hypothetical protein BYT27DRAFT_7240804 [Phlegmacium glaucopus]|nr:hypothetical protein BYT27DRAFT_7240804 [Phlegmacium glaucopus]
MAGEELKELKEKCLAFELYCVGSFDLSHASITSPEALSALPNLHKSNSDLVKELSRDSSASNDVEGTNDREPAFSRMRHIASWSVDDGVLVAEDGGLLRTFTPEDVEFDQDNFKELKVGPVVEPVLGKGRRMNTTGSDVNDRS